MDDFLKIILGILCCLILFNIVYSYITFSSFSCPDCPECPTIQDVEPPTPNNKYLSNYILNNFVEKINDDLKSIDFLKENVLFANNFKVSFELDAESIMAKIKKDIEDKTKFSSNKIIYIQSTDQAKKDAFIKQYNLNEYPAPLIYFEGSNLLFGYLDYKNKWMIMIDVTKI